MTSAEPLLELDEVCVEMPGPHGGWSRVVDRVSLTVSSGERVALVGESGSGKSLTALAALGLVPEPGAVRGGSITVAGVDLRTASSEQLQRLRGGEVGLVPQEPSGWLNPVLSVASQLSETLRWHHDLGRAEARHRALRLLEAVAFPEPAAILPAFPHQLSGGEGQRVMLALALAGEPRLLIADEPTTALDLTTQAQVLALVQRICEERGLALLVISHDLAVVTGLVDRVLVMHAGEIVEQAPTAVLFESPLHPYTRMLVEAHASRGDPAGSEARAAVVTAAPAPAAGCRYVPRCELARTACSETHPRLELASDGRRVRCPVVRGEEGER